MQKPKGVPRRQRRISIQRERMHCLCGTPFGLLPQGYVNKKPLSLEKLLLMFCLV